MNRTGIIPLLLLILITSSPPVLIAEVVTQSFDGNRSAVLPGVLLTRRMNTIALNYQQDQYDVKHLKTTLTSATLEPARETESISKKRQQLLISTVYGSDFLRIGIPAFSWHRTVFLRLLRKEHKLFDSTSECSKFYHVRYRYKMVGD